MKNKNYNLNFNLLKHIIIVLNNSRFIKNAAKKLKISIRSLYRYIKKNNLKKENDIWNLYI